MSDEDDDASDLDDDDDAAYFTDDVVSDEEAPTFAKECEKREKMGAHAFVFGCVVAWLLGSLVRDCVACLVRWLAGWFAGWLAGWLVKLAAVYISSAVP